MRWPTARDTTASLALIGDKRLLHDFDPGQGVPRAWISRRIGGHQVDYADESPQVRQTFAEALVKVGLKPRMDEAYQAELADLPPKLSQKA